MKTLNEVMGFLNEIPYINSGGCAIASLAMYRWLKNNNMLKEDTMFVYLYFYKSDSYEQNCLAINEGTTPSSCSHTVLWHDGFYIDSKGLYSKSELYKKDYQYFLEIHNEYFIVNSINGGNWNDSFERSWIEEIQNELGIDLSDILYDMYIPKKHYTGTFQVSSNNIARLYP